VRRPAILSLIVFGATLFFGLALRCHGLGQALLFGDEWHTLKVVGLPLGEILLTFDRYGTGIAYPALARLCAGLLGMGHLALRLPALVGGVLLLRMVFVAARRTLGREVAWIALLVLALNSMAIFYSGFARSYSLVCALALVLLFASDTYLAVREAPRWCLPTVALAGALLPYLHLTAASSSVGVGVGAIACACLRRNARKALSLTGAFALGGLLALALHAPAWGGLQDFVGRKTHNGYYGEFGALDIAALFLGNRTLAWVVGAALFASIIHCVSRLRTAALPLLGALLAPPLAVLVARPFGDAYAYARYTMASLPMAAIFLGWGTWHLVLRFSRDARRREVALPVVGAGVSFALFLCGGYGWKSTDDGVFSNSYISLFPLAAFDRSAPELEEVYRVIAADEGARGVLEIPHLVSRGIFYYRNAALVHGKRVQTGFMARPQKNLPEGYVSLAQDDWLERVDADYVILHLDVLAEVEKYWTCVYSEEPFDPSVNAYMERHRRFGKAEETGRPSVVTHIQSSLGRPIYQSPTVIAWKLALD